MAYIDLYWFFFLLFLLKYTKNVYSKLNKKLLVFYFINTQLFAPSGADRQEQTIVRNFRYYPFASKIKDFITNSTEIKAWCPYSSCKPNGVEGELAWWWICQCLHFRFSLGRPSIVATHSCSKSFSDFISDVLLNSGKSMQRGREVPVKAWGKQACGKNMVLGWAPRGH